MKVDGPLSQTKRRMEDGLLNELSRRYRDRIESESAVYVFKHFIGVDIFFISASVGLLRTQRLHLGLSLILLFNSDDQILFESTFI